MRDGGQMAEKLFIGVRGTVLALDASSGTELWRTRLKGADFVNVTALDRQVIAATKGEVFALDPASGTMLWQNKLKGLGLGFVTVAGSDQVTTAAANERRRRSAANS